MIGVNSTGAFGTHNANQSLLNSRKGRPFLQGSAVRRFQNSDIELAIQEPSKSKRKQFKAWLKKDNAMERKISLLTLVVSFLAAKVILLLIA
ncbi:hypothetical protein [Roseivirga misakiensis]|uniref:Uncharacterized protein n=1 Tax=Roseivirga misakiensis TaxID=1563681 RepID=A0A1E5SYP7_9BACT|nr:hypothetical protein [Roseivirga misakiensis]OEK04258.1 hypothetical protein BFP71_12300 [Roseivirga misakiensis]